MSPLCRASESGDVQSVLALLRTGADPNEVDDEGEVPLVLAAYAGHVAVARLLIEHGANARISTYTTPLIAAADAGHVEMVRTLLLAAGNEAVDDRDEDGRTAVDAATEGRHADVVAILRWAGRTDAPEQ